MRPRFTTILGVNVHKLTYPKVLAKIKNWIDKDKKEYVCVANVHAIMECQKDTKLLKGYNQAGLVTPDGMPLVWLSGFYGRKTERIYGPHLLNRLCGLAERKSYKVFFLGGIDDLSKHLLKKIKGDYPKLNVVGHKNVPVRPIAERDNRVIVKQINSSKAQLVFVGLGCPHQENWMISNRKKLRANVLIGVGAAFDFISGRVKQAPAWIQNIGFEWMFRLTQDPARLWRRYTITNFLFLYKIFSQLTSDFLRNQISKIIHKVRLLGN